MNRKCATLPNSWTWLSLKIEIRRNFINSYKTNSEGWKMNWIKLYLSETHLKTSIFHFPQRTRRWMESWIQY